jgi:adenine/guanine phosphoribosyltransferase-like PRPP-binding protein
MTITTRAFYLAEVFDDFDALVERARHRMALVKFDTIVGTGLSGALVIPRLAAALGCHWMIVRKDNDNSHSDYKTEGTLGHRWMFVDDLISTGTTYKRVREAITDLAGRRDFSTEHVGVYLYADNKLSEIA